MRVPSQKSRPLPASLEFDIGRVSNIAVSLLRERLQRDDVQLIPLLAAVRPSRDARQ